MHLTASYPDHLHSHLVYPQLGNNGNFLEYLQEPLMSTSIPPTSPAFVVLPQDLEIEYADVKGPMPDRKRVFIPDGLGWYVESLGFGFEA